MPHRSHTATNTLFRYAVIAASEWSTGRPSGGRGSRGQFVGSASRSAPASASPRAAHARRHHAPRDSPILNSARYDSPGPTTVRPAPLFSAFVGAVIGSKQMNSCPGGANACAYG